MIKFDCLIVEGTKDSWISFASSIISGFITMLALYFAFKQSNKGNIKSVRPFILVTPEFNINYTKDRKFILFAQDIRNDLVEEKRI